MQIIKGRYSFINDAYYQLGIDGIRELAYNTTLIKRELVKISDRPLVKKIIELLIKKIGYQNPVDRDASKKYLREVYQILGINRGATASKLKDYFIIKESSKQRDGKTIIQIELIKEKTNLK
ncbi:hypothetical protein CLV62_10315 [Dysgonomonas alginatilytica]|uniref:Uncharacterized protein n=1 Tax=Dysgonomonas alginatilytica TaxID=1605892 RepID=A0A2V3PTK6_9BACT|nr:hypothetical protein [Dysgonomonas alginatilytica]PXV67342.1 hypothetical protein CLV62_10315 [Dysgonomonas alginatilytica]